MTTQNPRPRQKALGWVGLGVGTYQASRQWEPWVPPTSEEATPPFDRIMRNKAFFRNVRVRD
jgi:hypothetical protein